MSTNLKRFQSRTAYYIWIGVFVLIMVSLVGGLYWATMKIHYTWRWFRVPSYFVNQAEIEITAEIEGEVSTILTEGEEVAITVKGADGEETYRLPSSEDIRIRKGDYIYMGDVLATYREWRPGILLKGLGVTLQASLYATFFGIIIGLLGGVCRVSSNPALKWTAVVYVEIIRGSPLLVQLFIWYFVLAKIFNDLLRSWSFGEIPPLGYGVAALAFFAGAYITEIVRSGIESIHHGQIEASRSLGMTYTQTMRYIVLPQAIRRILPPLAGQFISLIKDSSLLGMIAVRELLKATREAITITLQPFEFWFLCALLYLLITFPLSMLVQQIERRMKTS
jgi:polar amino acid transport system permease protein